MRLGTNMDNDLDHAKIVFQPATGRLCSPDSTNSEHLILESKSSDRLSMVNSLSSDTDINRRTEHDTSFELEDIQNEPVNIVSSTEQSRKIRLGELRRNNPISAKLVFLNWWLDTLGNSKPLRSAWEDEENDTFGCNADSCTQSLIDVDGQWPSCCNVSESGACMNVSKYDVNTQKSFSDFNGPMHFLTRTNEKLKIKLKSFWPHLSSVSPDISVYDKFNLNQQLTATDAKPGHKKYSTSTKNQSSDNEHTRDDSLSWQTSTSCTRHADNDLTLDDTLSWQTTTSCTKHVHDQNASSNVVNEQILSHILYPDSQLNKVNTDVDGQVQNLLDIVHTSSVAEMSVQWTGTRDKQNSHLMQSQQNLERYTSNDVKDNVEPELPQINGYEKTTFLFSENENTQPSSTSQEFHTVSYSKHNEYNSRVSHCDILANNKNNRIQSTQQYAQNYQLPCTTTLPDDGHLITADGACAKPMKINNSAQYINERCSSSNSCFESKHKAPNSDYQGRKCLAEELDNKNQMFCNEITKSKFLNNDPCSKQCSSIHDVKVNMKSYFSRLAEKKLRTKGCLKNSHQDRSQCDQFPHCGHTNVDSTAIQVPSSTQSTHSTQSKGELQSPTTVTDSRCKPGFNNDNLVTYKNSFSDGPDNTLSGSKHPVSQHMSHISKAFSLGTEFKSSYTSAQPSHMSAQPSHMSASVLKCAVTHLDHADYSLDQVQAVKGDYYKDKDDNDLIVCNSLDKEMKMEASELCNCSSIINDRKNITLNFHEDSIPQSVPTNNRRVDKQNSSNFEWIAASWSNTSLPPLHSFGSGTCQMKNYARPTESTTDLKDQKQKEILKKAKLLILMLNELPMSDLTKIESLFLENKESDFHVSSKIENSNCQWTLSHVMPLPKKHNSYNKGKLSIKSRKEGKRQPPTKRKQSIFDKISYSENVCSHIPEPQKEKPLFSNQEPAVKATNKTLLRMPFIDKSTSNENLDSSKMSVQNVSMQPCMKSANQINKDKHQLRQIHPDGKYLYEPQHTLHDTTPIIFTENMPDSVGSPENELTSERVQTSPKSEYNTASSSRADKAERNKLVPKKDPENIINESHIKSATKKVSNKLSKEQSHRQLEIKLSEATIDNKTEKLSVSSTHGLEANSVPYNTLVCHKQRPCTPDTSEIAAQDTSQAKMTLFPLPSLTRKVPVFPKPRPNALGQVPDEDSSVPSKVSDLSSSGTSELSAGSFKRQLSTCKHPWTKTDVNRNVTACEIFIITTPPPLHSVNQNINYTETIVQQKSNKEISNSKTQMKVLPPLQYVNSEIISSQIQDENPNLHNCKTPYSATLHGQLEKVEPQQHPGGTKEYESSLVPLDVMPKSQCRPKCNSPKTSRKFYRKTPLTSLHNTGMLQNPLRRKFDRLKYKVSDTFLQITSSPKSKSPFVPPSTCRSITTDNADMMQTNRHDPEVSIAKCYTSDPLQFSLAKDDNSGEKELNCSSELPSSSKITNTQKKCLHSERDMKITRVVSQHDMSSGTVDGEYESDPVYSGNIKCNKICLENKEITNNAHPASVKNSNKISVNLQKSKTSENEDADTPTICQENLLQFGESKIVAINEKEAKSETKNSKKRYRKSKTRVKKAQCPCTSSFKFLMLLLSDDLEADVI